MAATFDILLVIAGIAILYWGAEWLIRGSAQVARAFGVKLYAIALNKSIAGHKFKRCALSHARIDHRSLIGER